MFDRLSSIPTLARRCEGFAPQRSPLPTSVAAGDVAISRGPPHLGTPPLRPPGSTRRPPPTHAASVGPEPQRGVAQVPAPQANVTSQPTQSQATTIASGILKHRILVESHENRKLSSFGRLIRNRRGISHPNAERRPRGSELRPASTIRWRRGNGSPCQDHRATPVSAGFPRTRVRWQTSGEPQTTLAATTPSAPAPGSSRMR